MQNSKPITQVLDRYRPEDDEVLRPGGPQTTRAC
jgi:hypothetical protein